MSTRYPDNETFVLEIEREVLNEAPAHQGPILPKPVLAGGEFIVAVGGDGRVWWNKDASGVKNFVTACEPCRGTTINACASVQHVPQSRVDALTEGPYFDCTSMLPPDPAGGTVSSGIRYYSNLNGVKQAPYNIGTCCEGQGTRLYASLHEFVFSVPAEPAPVNASTQLYVDLYTPSSIALAPLLVGGEFVVAVGGDGRVWWVGSGTPGVKNYLPQCTPCGTTSAINGCDSARRVSQAFVDALAEGPVFECAMLPTAGTVSVATAFPLSDDVTVTVSIASAAIIMAPSLQLDLALRVPAWAAAAAGAVPVLVDGARWPQDGVPGTYLHVSSEWPAGTASNVTFSLTRALAAHAYTGATQRPPFARYGFTFGPLLLAFVVASSAANGTSSSWNATMDAVTLGGVDPTRPVDWLLPVGGNSSSSSITFRIASAPDVVVMPYGNVDGEQFSVYVFACVACARYCWLEWTLRVNQTRNLLLCNTDHVQVLFMHLCVFV
jgi:hypothetical protein